MAQPNEEKKEEEDKLLKIREEIGAPVKLSELEREKFNNTFEALKEWMDDANASMLKKDRDQAYRYVNLLISHLQMVDVDFIAGASKATPMVISSERDVPVEPEGPPHNIKTPPQHERPTKEQVDGWIENMHPGMKEKATVFLTCLKQYLDPESDVGLQVICNDCSPEKMVACIRAEDPSIEDSSTVFMKLQLGR